MRSGTSLVSDEGSRVSAGWPARWGADREGSEHEEEGDSFQGKTQEKVGGGAWEPWPHQWEACWIYGYTSEGDPTRKVRKQMNVRPKWPTIEGRWRSMAHCAKKEGIQPRSPTSAGGCYVANVGHGYEIGSGRNHSWICVECMGYY